MEPATWLILIIVALAVLSIIVLPMRRRWNEGGEDDEARRQAIERDVSEEEA